MRQVFVKTVPGAKTVPSGMDTSVTNSALSQVEIVDVEVAVGVKVGVGGVVVPVLVKVGLGTVPVAVTVAVGVKVLVTILVPETTISTQKGLLADEPMPNKAPLAFLNIQ